MSAHADRLKLMAKGDPTWDLSDNDRIAIAWAIARIEALTEALALMLAAQAVLGQKPKRSGEGE